MKTPSILTTLHSMKCGVSLCLFTTCAPNQKPVLISTQKKCLRRDKIKYLEEKFPPTDYESTAEWVNALIGEILSTSVAAKLQFEAPELGYRADDLEQALREWRTDQQVKGSIVYSRELLEYELKETERLNAMIVKQTRHCAELKAWEEVEKARSKHSAASKQRFFSAPGLARRAKHNAVSHTVIRCPLRNQTNRWTRLDMSKHVNAHFGATAKSFADAYFYITR